MEPPARHLSLPSLAVGLLMGTVLVTACPIAAEDGLEWLDSESDDEEEDEIPGGLVADAPDPLQSTNRLLLASEDSSRWVGGITSGSLTIVEGPVFVNSVFLDNSTGLYIFNGPCPAPVGFNDFVNVDGNTSVEVRLFIPEGHSLCLGNAFRVAWSGFVPYY